MTPPETETLPADMVAIVGVSGRFPGAEDIAAFWRNLREGVESVERFSEAELRAAGVSESLLKDPRYVPAGTVLAHLDCFDADFFGYTPREAELMDPQHRVFLEAAWAAIEDAGYDVERCNRSFGVFAGAGLNHYFISNVAANPDIAATGESYQAALGAEKDFLATRVSYKLNLKGPSIGVQTSCSTSLVAVHQACQSLLLYECDLALAGGVFAGVPGRLGYLYHDGMILSRDGHCRAFDAGASGTVAGKGVAAVVLKRLSDAVADGDRIYAVVRGSAVNNDGALKVSYMAPSVAGQAEVIRRALDNAGVSPDSIDYVEAHGTGTQLGDPAEIAGLCRAFGKASHARRCALGSVKTNMGHLDAAAGVTGLIKTALALYHGEIPPSLHFAKPNPEIDFAGSPFEVNTSLRPWPQTGRVRRAGVSCFGVGGTNAHVVLEEAPPPPRRPDRPGASTELLILSARNPAALQRQSANLAAHLRAQPELELRDVAHTLQRGRRQFGMRRMWVVESLNEAVASLENRRYFDSTEEPQARGVVFLLTGQGSQYPGMGHGLYQQHEVFRRAVDECADRLQPMIGADLRRLIWDGLESAEQAARLEQTDLAQPALFVLDYALAQLWMSWGISPSAMIGHSLGEYVAACLAGVFSLADALHLVAERGRLMRVQPAGGMTAVSASPQPIQEAIGGLNLTSQLSLAALNGPAMSVVSGPFDALEKFEAEMRRRGIELRRLHTSHAFHSPMMGEAAAAFERTVRRVRLNPPSRRFVSNVTGRWISTSEATDPGYWSRHMLSPVRFGEGLHCIEADGDRIWLEVGPGHALATLAKAQVKEPSRVLHCLRHAREKLADSSQLLNAVGRMWLLGEPIDWEAFGRERDGRCVGLPTYPFERERFWIEPRSRRAVEPASASASTPARLALENWFYLPIWKPGFPAGQPACSCGSWLVVGEEGALLEALAEQLRRAGHCVAVAVPGRRFQAAPNGRFSLNLTEAGDVVQLFRTLSEQAAFPEKVVFLPGTGAGQISVEPAGRSEPAADVRAFHQLLAIARGLGETVSMAVGSVDLLLVCRGAISVAGECRLDVTQGLLLGASRVISDEYPRIRCRCIDVLEPGENRPGLAELLRELQLDTLESPVALRGGRRWLQGFEASACAEVNPAVSRLRTGGVYLITGGLGGIGLELGAFLARKYRARLILVSRRTLPGRDRWAAIATNPENDPDLARIVRAIQDMEAAGAEVLPVAADVCSLGEMQRAVEAARDRFGSIQGVLHAAGKAGGGIIALRSPEDLDAVLAPKVQGTRVLGRVFDKVDLDFVALFSSMASILGGAGQADYAAANGFLDAYAEERRWQGDLRFVSLNWDLWGEVGMGREAVRDNPGLQASRAAALGRGIRSAEGSEAFERALCLGLPRVLISTTRPVLNPSLPPRATGASSTPAPSSRHTRSQPSLSGSGTGR